MRGDRIGLVGNNGVGKSTLLRLLLGELEPQAGVIKHGTNLEIAYFDQMRQLLDHDKSVAHNVGDGRDHVTINGKPQHVVGYLRGFLFSAKRALTPVGSLSGGERNRVILAKLFTQPSNLLVLDEPTNDLDVETLEVLEERLGDYSGTLLVVSHDREFLDNVVNQDPGVRGRRADCRVRRAASATGRGAAVNWRKWMCCHRSPSLALPRARRASQRGPARKAVKLGYMEQRELDMVCRTGSRRWRPRSRRWSSALRRRSSMRSPGTRPNRCSTGSRRKNAEHDRLAERWLELEERQAALATGRAD
jgi:ABC transport system ATP-binding/permease protein